MTTSIIKPTIITDAMFTSSTAPETDYTVWAFGTYALGARRMMTTGVHRNYECISAHTSTDATGAPNLNPTKWVELGATNKWAMLDKKVGTVTTLASPLTVVMSPGSISGLALLELTGKQVVISVKNVAGGTVVYNKTINLDGTIIGSIYDWFFEDYAQLTDLTLTDLPSQYFNPEITVTLTSTAGNVGIGVFVVGKVFAIGNAQYGATAGIKSFSIKQADAWGNMTLVKRSNSKRNNFSIITEKSRFNLIYRTLSALDSIECVFIGTEEAQFEPLVSYGFYIDFSIVVSYPTEHLTNLEIEGLI